MTGFEDFLSGTVRLCTPLLLAALGEMLGQRSGIINISIEGMMLGGAFAGFSAAYFTGSPIVGLVAAILTGLALGCVFAFFCITEKCDQIVVGAGLNIALAGLTGVLFRGLFGIETFRKTSGFNAMSVPFLSDIPVIRALLNQSIFVYLAIFIAVMLWILMMSPWGLTLKSCGIQPDAADAAGINVCGVRWTAILFASAMAATAGAFLSLAQTNSFSENMTSGKGFIALSVVIFGRWNPLGIIIAALAFGAADQAQWWLQAKGSVISVGNIMFKIPYQWLLATPYVFTLAALAIWAGKYRGPKALGQPFVRSS